MALAGTLRQTSLVDVLHLIDEERRAGLLLIKSGTLSAELYLDARRILCVQRSGIGQSFSERLLYARLVTPQQFDAVRALHEEKPITTEVDLARALLQYNYLTERELRDWVADDTVELLVIALSWDDGDFQFEESVRPPPGRLVIPVPISVVLDEALHHIDLRHHRVSTPDVPEPEDPDKQSQKPSTGQSLGQEIVSRMITRLHQKQRNWRISDFSDFLAPSGDLFIVDRGEAGKPQQRLYHEYEEQLSFYKDML